MFFKYSFIESNAESLLHKIKNKKYLKEVSEKDIPIRLAYYLSKINVIHFFREDKGRTQRLFIEYLSEESGYNIDFS